MSKDIAEIEAPKMDDAIEPVLGITSKLCRELPHAIGACSESANVCVVAKMDELGIIHERMTVANPDEMPDLVEQSNAAYKAINHKDLENKLFGIGLTAIIVGGLVLIAKIVA